MLAELAGRQGLDSKYVVAVLGVYADASVDDATIEVLREAAEKLTVKKELTAERKSGVDTPVCVEREEGLKDRLARELASRLDSTGTASERDASHGPSTRTDGYDFLLVLELGDRTLHDALTHERIAGHDFFLVRKMAADLAHALHHLHVQGQIHADFKPLNTVRVGSTWQLIDLDVSCKLGADFGSKVPSSGYCPPEMARAMLAAAEAARCEAERVEAEKEESAAEAALRRPVTSNSSSTAEHVSSRTGVGRAPPAPSANEGGLDTAVLVREYGPASIAYDLWSFGAVLFYLVTGRSLWHTNQSDDVWPEDLCKLAEWAPRDISALWQGAVKSNPTRDQVFAFDLLRNLLEPDPRVRLAHFCAQSDGSAMCDAMLRVLEHAFFQGHQSLRPLKCVATSTLFECEPLAEPQTYHVLLSHAWPLAQDRVRIIKDRLAECLPSCRTFLEYIHTGRESNPTSPHEHSMSMDDVSMILRELLVAIHAWQCRRPR